MALWATSRVLTVTLVEAEIGKIAITVDTITSIPSKMKTILATMLVTLSSMDQTISISSTWEIGITTANKGTCLATVSTTSTSCRAMILLLDKQFKIVMVIQIHCRQEIIKLPGQSSKWCNLTRRLWVIEREMPERRAMIPTTRSSNCHQWSKHLKIDLIEHTASQALDMSEESKVQGLIIAVIITDLEVIKITIICFRYLLAQGTTHIMEDTKVHRSLQRQPPTHRCSKDNQSMKDWCKPTVIGVVSICSMGRDPIIHIYRTL